MTDQVAASLLRTADRGSRDRTGSRGGREPVRSVDQRPGETHPLWVVAAICVVGLVLTALGTLFAARADGNTEQRLLEGQTRRAASVLSNAITAIQSPMSATLAAFAAKDAIETRAVGTGGEDRAFFAELMSAHVAADSVFVSASLWRAPDNPTAGTTRQLATLGVAPATQPGDVAMQRLLDRALGTSTTVVTRAQLGEQARIGYTLADPATGYIIYAERAIPADRRAPVDRDSAYADLDYAIYLGDQTSTSAMTTTSVDPESLPLRGTTYSTTVPFGDTVLSLVTTPRRHLGSPLSKWSPIIVLIAGMLLTLAAALTGHRLARARQRVDVLYDEQRDLSIQLQRALLPQSNPDIPGLEIATEYVAAAQGVDVGGDWFSVLPISKDRYAFVVGDVSGHGVDAVAVMARVRFTLRAHLSDGDTPCEALRKCASHVDIETDGHIVTALVGLGDLRTGELTLATAGHPPPLLANDAETVFARVPVGPPLGGPVSDYDSAKLTLPVGTVFLAYTDGLIERRDEDIDAGMNRLAGAVANRRGAPLPLLVAGVLATMSSDHRSADDIAVVALRRTDPLDA